MSEAYLGEVRAFGFGFAPQNWLPCDGRLVQISQMTALFSILGTNFGGDGVRTFGLPNLQGAVAVGAGAAPGLSSYSVGETGGATTVQINATTLAAHTHTLQAAGARYTANANVPGPSFSLAPGANATPYSTQTTPVAVMAPNAIGAFGAASPTPHNNLMPYAAVNFCICTNGVFPQRP